MQSQKSAIPVMGSSVDWTWPGKVSEFGDKSEEASQTERQREKIMKNKTKQNRTFNDNF